MPRPRKFVHCGPAARDLAARGLSAAAIADQLGVSRSSVHRWRVRGQLGETRGSPGVAAAVVVALETPAPTWAAAIRGAYALDATDEQLVQLAEFALSVTQNLREAASVRLAAVGRFQSLVKQLVARLRPTAKEPSPAAGPTARVDPRRLLIPTIQ